VREPPEHAQVLAPGEQLVHRRELAREGDPLPHRRRLGDDVEAEHLGAPGVGSQQRRQHADDRRLAGAVRAQQPEH
jgi:hypothetical protein